MSAFELIEHTADIAIRAWGLDMPSAFEAAAEALMYLLGGGAEVHPGERVSFEIESVDQEGLLVGMLSELVLRFDADSHLFGDFVVKFIADNKISVSAGYEEFDPRRHGGGTDVKGVSYHMLRIEKESDRTLVQVLFDV